jgi:hypothetical protein
MSSKTVMRHACSNGRMVESATGAWVHWSEVEPLLRQGETAAERKFTGVGELERTGYIPDGSAAERETTAGPDRRPLCENCGEQYHKHGKGNLACPGSEMGNVYRAQATPAMPHASLALKEFMSELGEIMSMEDGATPADYLRRAREIRQWCSDHQGSAVKTSGGLPWMTSTSSPFSSA